MEEDPRREMACWILPTFTALTIVVSLAFLQVAFAQNSPQDYLHAHNAARAVAGVDPLRWDSRLARYAQIYAEERAGDCKLVDSGGPYGENIFRGHGRPYMAYDAVRSWVREKRHYDYGNNSCDPGRVCGHYTQVVWADTERVGCGRVRCSSAAYYIVCNYDPPGNMAGQWPYAISA